jgi:hypothetical protein
VGTLHAYILMRNHVHILLETGSQPLSHTMQSVQFTYSQYSNRRYGQDGSCLSRALSGHPLRAKCLRVRSCIVHYTEPLLGFIAHLFHHTLPDQPSHPTARIKTRYRESLVFLDQNDMKSLALDQPALGLSNGSERTDDRRH